MIAESRYDSWKIEKPTFPVAQPIPSTVAIVLVGERWSNHGYLGASLEGAFGEAKHAAAKVEYVRSIVERSEGLQLQKSNNMYRIGKN